MSTDSAAPELESLYQQVDELLNRIHAVDTTPATDHAVLSSAEKHERAFRMSSIDRRRVLDASDRGMVGFLGYRNIRDFMSDRLRVPDASRRMHHMRMIGSLRSFNGEPLPARYGDLAKAVEDGDCASAHVDAVLDIMSRIPAHVPSDVRGLAGFMMADFSRQLTPKELTRVGVEMLARMIRMGR